MIDPANFCFIDLEASGLSESSYPTEVGWAMIADGRLIAGSVLIRPAPSWRSRPDSWMPAAEAVTGITLAMLDEMGLPPAEAFARFAAAADGRILVTDNPDSDGFWLDQLAAAAGADGKIELADLEAVIRMIQVSPRNREMATAAAKALVPLVHRAEPDAVRHAILVGLLAGVINFGSIDDDE